MLVFLDIGATWTLWTFITLFQPVQCFLTKSLYIHWRCLPEEQEQREELCRKELSLWVLEFLKTFSAHFFSVNLLLFSYPIPQYFHFSYTVIQEASFSVDLLFYHMSSLFVNRPARYWPMKCKMANYCLPSLWSSASG